MVKPEIFLKENQIPFQYKFGLKDLYLFVSLSSASQENLWPGGEIVLIN